MISDLISQLHEKIDLTYEQTNHAISAILEGKTTQQQTMDFLSCLTQKGECDDEILGILDVMDKHLVKIMPENQGTIIDVCGTGGDGLCTFNISTAAAFVISASGGIVAKHGNRSISSILGSADIFEYFGYDLNQSAKNISDMLEKFNICFMFAQKFHPAMKNIALARKQIGRRTVFNILGPLSNPAGVKNQLIGVSSNELLIRIPSLLKKRGGQNIMTVRSADGMDEFSTSTKNQICFLTCNKTVTNIIDPQILGLHKSSLRDIQVKTKQQAIQSFLKILDGTANTAMIETTILNAAAGLIVGNIAKNFDDGIEIAANTIKSGKAFVLLEDFIKYAGKIEILEAHTS